MTQRFGLATVTAVLCAATLGWAQTPQSQQPSTSGQGMESRDDAPVTVVGCLQREADVPGHSPNVAERAGIGEDFILTDAEVKSGSSPDTGAGPYGQQPGQSGQQPGQAGQPSEQPGQQPGQPGQYGQQPAQPTQPGQAGQPGQPGSMTGQMASSKMFKVEGIDDEQLRQHLNKRVEITGRLDDSNDSGSGPGATGYGQGQSGQSAPGTTGSGQSETGAGQGTGIGQSGAGQSMSMANMPEIEATSIRQVAGECAQPRAMR